MKVLFMGTPAFAAESLKALLETGHDVQAVVTRSDARAGRGLKPHPHAVKQVALSRGIPILQPEDLKSAEFLGRLATFGADIFVVVAYGRILPQRILDVAPRGAINVHASLLPRLRGASPIVWAIARGDRETGVTTMRMVGRLDAGDILLQRATPIGPDETAGQLETRLAAMGASLLVETLAGLESGSITPKPQNEAAATWAPLLGTKDGIIDWSLPASEIAWLVRAFDPWPVARTSVPARAGRRIRIWKARAAAGASPAARAEPGTILGLLDVGADQEAGLLIACGGGTTLLVTELQPEDRRRMPARAAVVGRHLAPGDRLGGG